MERYPVGGIPYEKVERYPEGQRFELELKPACFNGPSHFHRSQQTNLHCTVGTVDRVDTVDSVDTVDRVDTVDTEDTVQAHYLQDSNHWWEGSKGGAVWSDQGCVHGLVQRASGP